MKKKFQKNNQKEKCEWKPFEKYLIKTLCQVFEWKKNLIFF